MSAVERRRGHNTRWAHMLERESHSLSARGGRGHAKRWDLWVAGRGLGARTVVSAAARVQQRDQQNHVSPFFFYFCFHGNSAFCGAIGYHALRLATACRRYTAAVSSYLSSQSGLPFLFRAPPKSLQKRASCNRPCPLRGPPHPHPHPRAAPRPRRRRQRTVCATDALRARRRRPDGAQ